MLWHISGPAVKSVAGESTVPLLEKCPALAKACYQSIWKHLFSVKGVKYIQPRVQMSGMKLVCRPKQTHHLAPQFKIAFCKCFHTECMSWSSWSGLHIWCSPALPTLGLLCTWCRFLGCAACSSCFGLELCCTGPGQPPCDMWSWSPGVAAMCRTALE